MADLEEKLALIEGALEKGLVAMQEMAGALRDVTDCLSDMTVHYVELAGCGDCGHWNPEEESEVIAARKMIADTRAALAGLERPTMTKPEDIAQWAWDASIKALWTDAMHEGECPGWMETQVALVARAILAATEAEREERGEPRDGDELMEFPEVRGLSFECPKCATPYAEVVAFKVTRNSRAA